MRGADGENKKKNSPCCCCWWLPLRESVFVSTSFFFDLTRRCFGWSDSVLFPDVESNDWSSTSGIWLNDSTLLLRCNERFWFFFFCSSKLKIKNDDQWLYSYLLRFCFLLLDECWLRSAICSTLGDCGLDRGVSSSVVWTGGIGACFIHAFVWSSFVGVVDGDGKWTGGNFELLNFSLSESVVDERWKKRKKN